MEQYGKFNSKKVERFQSDSAATANRCEQAIMKDKLASLLAVFFANSKQGEEKRSRKLSWLHSALPFPLPSAFRSLISTPRP